MNSVIKWLSSRECDFCKNEIKKELYDAQTVYGCWATMCKECFEHFSTHRLGTGFGQKYEETNGEFVKVQG